MVKFKYKVGDRLVCINDVNIDYIKGGYIHTLDLTIGKVYEIFELLRYDIDYVIIKSDSGYLDQYSMDNFMLEQEYLINNRNESIDEILS